VKNFCPFLLKTEKTPLLLRREVLEEYIFETTIELQKSNVHADGDVE